MAQRMKFALFFLLCVAYLASAVCTRNIPHVSACCQTLQAWASLFVTLAQNSLLSGMIVFAE